MANIVNDRDKALQATIPRLTATSVTISSAAGASFIKLKNTNTVSPANLTLSVNTTGFTSATRTWYYASSTSIGTFNIVSEATVLGLTNSNFTTHLGSGTFVRYKCVASQTGWTTVGTYFDISYSEQANDSPILNITKEALILPTTGLDVCTYTDAYTDISVTIGGTAVTYAASGNNTFSVSVGTLVGTATVTPSTITNSRRLTISDMNGTGLTATAAIPIIIDVIDSRGITTTFNKTLNISKVTSGVVGTSAITGYLTNESHTVAAVYTGLGYSLTTAGGSFVVYNGIDVVTTSSMFSISGGTDNGTTWSKVQNGLTFTINETSGVYSLSGSSWTTDTESFTVIATYSSTSITKVYTISKAKAGTNGSPGTDASTIYLSTTTQGFTYDVNGSTPSPASATLTATATTPSGTIYYDFVKDGTSVQNTTSNSYTYSPQASYTNMPDSILVRLRLNGTGGTIMATDTITMIGMKPGATGAASTVAGPTGNSARIAYIVTTSASPPATPTAVAGDNPPTGWSFTPTATLTAGQFMYQSNGILSTNIAWTTPYLSNLKVGSLSALVANLGTVTLDTTGKLYSGTKSTYASTETGIFLGYDSAATAGYKFKIGTSTTNLGWDGSSLSITGGVFKTATSGARVSINEIANKFICHKPDDTYGFTVDTSTGTAQVNSYLNNDGLVSTSLGSGTAIKANGNSTGYGLVASGNTTKAPISIGSLTTSPSSALNGDIYCNNSATLANRGLYAYVSGTWLNISKATTTNSGNNNVFFEWSSPNLQIYIDTTLIATFNSSTKVWT